ncbi:MAG: DUF4279 domain-containing protein [Cyanobacteria bacterium REEB67]|nr:DUF4279 domain-containing protein [Cyanobacteria bacterium REEB67]
MSTTEDAPNQFTYQPDTTPTSIRATFRVYHPELDPNGLSERFDLKPSVAWRRNDDEYGWRKRPGHKAPSGGWLLSSRLAVKSNDAIGHVDWLLDQLSGRAGLIKQLQGEGYMIDVVVGWHAASWNTTPALTPTIMRRLANFNLPIWFDVYLYEGEGDPEA